MPAQTKGFYYSVANKAKRKAELKKRSFSQSIRSSPRHLVPNKDIGEGEEKMISEVYAAFSACRNSFADLETANLSGDEKLFGILSNVLRFYVAGTADGASQEAYNLLLKETDIKVTKNTRNPLLPAFKAIFGDTNKSSLGRYAAVLKFASHKNVEPNNLARFVKSKGGLVACAREGAELLNPNRATEKIDREQQHIEDLKKVGIRLNSSQFPKNIPQELSTLLILKDANQTIMLLGHRSVGSSAVIQFKPLDS